VGLKRCTQIEYHDVCRCIYEAKFREAVPAVINASDWATTKKAMQITYPWAALCVSIDEGFKENYEHLKVQLKPTEKKRKR
jgi:hypothetical protein